MLLDNTPPAYVSLKEGSWVSRVCLAEEGALYQRPVGWTHEDRAPPSTDPGVKVPYNTGIPDAVPPFGTVRVLSVLGIIAAVVIASLGFSTDWKPYALLAGWLAVGLAYYALVARKTAS